MSQESITIRKALPNDFERIWEIFCAVIKSMDTYAFDPSITKDEAYKVWTVHPKNLTIWTSFLGICALFKVLIILQIMPIATPTPTT